MKPLGRMMDHVWLAKRMGLATDLDMAAAHQDGVLSQEDWVEIVHTCQGCSWAPQCDEWLKKNNGQDCAPATCLNRARFEELRRRSTGAAS